jgi:hypothetical protein
VVIDVGPANYVSIHRDDDVSRTTTFSARSCHASCQNEEFPLPLRRQVEEHDGLRCARVDVRSSRPQIGTRQDRADTTLADDPKARVRSRRAAADEKRTCENGHDASDAFPGHTPTAVRHDLTIRTCGDYATACASVRECHPSGCTDFGVSRSGFTKRRSHGPLGLRRTPRRRAGQEGHDSNLDRSRRRLC